MRPIEWMEFMRVDEGSWDAARMAALDTLNKLCDPTIARDQAATIGVIDTLTDILAAAFEREEAEMAATDHGHAAWHAARHRHLLNALAVWRRRLVEEWRLGLGANIFLSFAGDLVRHFGDDDRGYAKRVAERRRYEHLRGWRNANTSKATWRAAA